MIVYKCDCCGAEIPIIKQKDIFGNKKEVLNRGILKCKEYDFKFYNRSLNFLMCKSCAEKYSAQLDYEILKFRTDILQYKERENNG